MVNIDLYLVVNYLFAYLNSLIFKPYTYTYPNLITTCQSLYVWSTFFIIFKWVNNSQYKFVVLECHTIYFHWYKCNKFIYLILFWAIQQVDKYCSKSKYI
jgi:hypothetical protein